MTYAFSIVAALAALAAVLAALRTQRHVRRLARALAREWGLRSEGGARSAAEPPPGPPPEAAREAWLRRSVESLEQRLNELLARTADLARAPAPAASPAPDDPGPAGDPDPRALIVRRLRALGYEEVALVPGAARRGGLLFEARREGLPVKGAARVDEAGQVQVRAAGPERSFP